jgi:flagellin-like protein
MNIASFILGRNRAQSEATGTILMIAVTIVAGATVAVFAFSVFDGGETAPQSDFDFEFQPDTTEVRVSLTQGDSIEGDQLRFSGAAVEKTSFGGITQNQGERPRVYSWDESDNTPHQPRAIACPSLQR